MSSTASLENSSILEHLQWDDDHDYCLDEFVDRFNPPQIVRVQETNNNSNIHGAQQLLTIHAVESSEKILAHDRKGREVHLPLDCSNRIELRPHSFRGVCETVAHLREYKFLRVTQGYYSMDDESCTISPGDKLEVVGVEEGTPGREGCLVVQNQTQATIRLPFSVKAGFQPLVDGREYTLKEASRAMELPIYFQFVDQPDPMGQERRQIGVFNCSLGVLKLEKVYRDSSVICTAMMGCATTVVVYPKAGPIKVTGMPRFNDLYSQICGVFQDRINLAKVSSKEQENIYASRKTIRKYQECIEASFAQLVIEKSVREEGFSDSYPILSDIQVTKGSGGAGNLAEDPVQLSRQRQETEVNGDDSHDENVDFASPQRVSSSELVGEPYRRSEIDCRTEGDNPVDLSDEQVEFYYVRGVTVMSIDDDDSSFDPSASFNVDPESNRPVGQSLEADQVPTQPPHTCVQPGILEQKTARERNENDPSTYQEPLIDTLPADVQRLDYNRNQIDSSIEQNGMTSNAEQEQKTSQKGRPPPVKEKPKRSPSMAERLELSTQPAVHLDANLPNEFSKPLEGERPTQEIPRDAVRPNEPSDFSEEAIDDRETPGCTAVGPEEKAKPIIPPKPRCKPPPTKTKPVVRMPFLRPVHRGSDTCQELGRSKEDEPPVAQPSSTEMASIPVEADDTIRDKNVEECPHFVETDTGHTGRCKGATTKPVATNFERHQLSAEAGPRDEEPSSLEETEAIERERGNNKESVGGVERMLPAEEMEVLYRPPLPQRTKPKPPRRQRFLSDPEGPLEAISPEKHRRPPPVKPKPIRKSSSIN